MSQFDFHGYAKLLKDWVIFSQKHLYRCPENPNLICYGAGEHGHWGVHTHQKAFSAFAVLAALKEIDLSDIPISREQLLEQALGMLRYNLHTHLEGDFVCTDGEKWGHNWIYSLGIERMFHGIEAIVEHLTQEDRDLLRRVMISESEYILHDYPVIAGLDGKAKLKSIADPYKNLNRPESNIWNGAILYRTAILYPDLPNKEKYIEKARKFLANGLSIESDENSDEIVDGVRIGDLFVGANMFDSYATNHHGYLNIGYMNICLSNIAMLHFFLKARNIKGDDMIYHHLYEQWRLIRSTTFDDGRLLRIGGDSRARYCYCQDYALPTWALIEDVFGEDCLSLENGWLKILQKETAINGDGSFLSNRFGHFENLSPVYYTRLESDRANTISMSLYWHQKFHLSGSKTSDKISLWKDDYHGSAFTASGNRYASFTWRSSEKPQGLIVPQTESSLAEWRFNLGARICGVGRKNYDDIDTNAVHIYAGGFLTYGSATSCSDDFMAEGQQKENMAKKQIAFAALPDDNTVLCLQYAKTLNRVFISEISGIFWNVPNDIFNERQRHITFEYGDRYLRGGDYANRYETLSLGHYVNVDDKIGLASKTPLTLVREGQRQVTIKNRENSGTLYAEEICAPFCREYQWIDRDTEILNVGFVLSLGNANETKRLSESLMYPEVKGISAIGVVACDNRTYFLLANFGSEDVTVHAADLYPGTATDLITNKPVDYITIQANKAALICF